LQRCIEYKAEMEGLQVEYINPRYTSQTCKCGHASKANRRGLLFSCTACGYTAHADANASYNIAEAISGPAKKKKRGK
ncbi:zinc ribbon domain-containing protein, partial [Shouchella shacheensis]|uniref:zinc ribbon domain-containing protein n=1 Tax=Shouchella shacheensis TaxID=1649580 RepID=UPI000B153543